MKIAILMSTYNGERFIDKQLASISKQKIESLTEVYIRDDGSTDSTLDIIHKWESKLNIKLFKENNVGPAKSFWNLLSKKEIEADYFAFCDQDDIWYEDKLSAAVEELKKQNCEALWCSNCRIINQDDQVVKDLMNNVKPDFSIVSQFICGTTQGCAMVINNKLRDYILDKNIKNIPMHDFVILTYAISKGKVIYDKNPYFGYRIHEGNVVASKGKNIFNHLRSSFKRWFSKEHRHELSRFAKDFLTDNESFLNNDTIKFLNDLIGCESSVYCRLSLFNRKVKIYNKRALLSFRVRALLGIL